MHLVRHFPFVDIKMDLDIAFVLLTGIISALNANLYEVYEYEYEEIDSYDYYEDYYQTITKTVQGISNIILFAKTMLLRNLPQFQP